MTALHGRSVLVAEDDAMVRLLLIDILEDAGCVVTEACDGADALSKLTDASVDLLLTEIRMPNLDRWALAEHARAPWPQLPVLYVTGWSDVSPRHVPDSRIIAKPYVPAQLLAEVETLLQAAEPASNSQQRSG